MVRRSFTDFVIGAFACVSVFVFAALLPEKQAAAEKRRHVAHQPTEERWQLPSKRHRRRTLDDVCRHCSGSGNCRSCAPQPCRICSGAGLQPRDATLVPRLTALWDGASFD
jgi:hypothetical protein